MKTIYSTICKILLSVSCITLLNFGSYAALHGSYTINPNNAASNSNYQNWASAVGDLLTGSRTDGGTAQGPGVSAAVTFTVYDMTYANTQVHLTAITGTSSSNTITFKSTSDSSVCKLQYAPGAVSTNDYVLLLDGVKYVTFNKIGFDRFSTTPGTFYTVIQITNSASNNTITHCWMRTLKTPSTSTKTFYYGIGSCIYFKGNGDSTTISQNHMMNGYNGVYDSIAATGIKITDNVIDSAGGSGILMSSNNVGTQNNLFISGNTINMTDFGVGSLQYTCYAIRVEYSPSVIITKNKCILSAVNCSVSRALIVYLSTSTAAAPALISNNFIVNSGGTGNCTGLSLYGAPYSQWYNNNVLILGTVAGGSALFLNTWAGSPSEVVNNNLINKGGTYAIDAYGANYTDLDTVDYNNYYTTGTDFGRWNGTTVTSFASWKTTSSKDVHSLNVDPGYTSNSNLHVSNLAINNKGRVCYSVKDDIDGEPRSTTTPDIGADEWGIYNDAGISGILSPVNNACPGTYNINAIFKNFGEDTIKTASITWSLNAVFQTPYTWIGSLAPLKTDTVTLGSYNFVANTNTIIKVISNTPNGKSDPTPSNDFQQVTRHISALPPAVAGADQIVCLGESTTVGPVSSTSFTYKWMDVSHTVLATTSQYTFKPGSPITLYFEVTAKTTQCVNMDTINIKTTPKPVPNAGLDQAICPGASASIGSTSQAGFSYSWTSIPAGFISTVSNPSVLPTGTTTYILKMTNDTTLCFAFDSVNVTFNALPTPKIIGDTVICEGNTTNYSSIPDSGSTYLWTVTGGNIVTGTGTNSVDINWPTSGSGTIEVIETNLSGCTDSAFYNVTISQNPIAYMNTSIICSGSQSTFIDSSSNVVSRIWDFGDGDSSTDANTTHAFAIAGTYNVKLTVFNSQGCFNTIIQPVVISAPPTVDFDIDSSACVGDTISITNNSTDASSFLWDLGNTQTSTLINPSYSYDSSGVYNVKLIAYGSGCQNSLTKSVTVNPNPVADFSTDTLGDTKHQTVFKDLSSISTGSITSWNWDFGDASTSTLQKPTHQYVNANTYDVELCVTSASGCVDCITKSIIITVGVGIGSANSDKTLTLYPNPSNGYFTVKSANQLDLIEVTSVLGKVVLMVKPNSTIVAIDLSTQPKGVYFVKVNSANYSTVISITKQ